MQKLCQLWLVWHKQGRDEPMLTLSLELSPPSIVAIDVAASEACILAGSSSQSDNVKNRLYNYDGRLQVVLVPFSLFCIASWDDFVLHLCCFTLIRESFKSATECQTKCQTKNHKKPLDSRPGILYKLPLSTHRK